MSCTSLVSTQVWLKVNVIIDSLCSRRKKRGFSTFPIFRHFINYKMSVIKNALLAKVIRIFVITFRDRKILKFSCSRKSIRDCLNYHFAADLNTSISVSFCDLTIVILKRIYQFITFCCIDYYDNIVKKFILKD